jgi:alkylation response protein AidB-like acyl-CoA dehydrogenase
MTEPVWSTTTVEAAVRRQVEARWGRLLMEVNAGAADREAAGTPLPERFLTAAGAQGLLGLSLPTPVGGGGLDLLSWIMVLEEIGYRCRDSGFALILGVRVAIAGALIELGRPDLIARYVRPMVAGKLGFALAYSEDADAFAMHTTLSRAPGGFRLSGRKDFLTGGQQADVILTYARDETGDLRACLVHRDDPGVEVIPLHPVGMHTSGPAALALRDVPLPEHRIVVATDGLSHAQRLLNARRLMVAAAPLGRARDLVERSVARLRTAIRQDEPLAERPNVQAAVGRMVIAVETSRAVLYRAAERVASGQGDPLFDPLVSTAKHAAVTGVRSVLEEALHVLGGHFYYGDPYFGTCLRDFAGLVAVAGTQDLLEINLGALLAATTTERTQQP